MTRISGNTYPVRHLIKALKFKWDPKNKCWERSLPLTPDEEEQMGELRGVILSGDGVFYNPKPMTYKQTYGRCEDAPCCGCCGPQWGEY